MNKAMITLLLDFIIYDYEQYLGLAEQSADNPIPLLPGPQHPTV